MILLNIIALRILAAIAASAVGGADLVADTK